MAPPVPSDDCKKKHVPEMSHIVCGIDANESAIPKALEHINLERGLHTQNESVPLQPWSRRRRSEFIFVKYIHILFF